MPIESKIDVTSNLVYILSKINKTYPKFTLTMPGNFVRVKDDKYVDYSDIVELFSQYAQDAVCLRIDFIGNIRGYTLSDYKDKHGDELAFELSKYQGKLEVLDLAYCNIDDNGMLKILAAIQNNEVLKEQLKVLIITGNNIGAATLEYLLQMLPECKNLLIGPLLGQALGAVDGGRGYYDPRNNIENRAETKDLVEVIKTQCQNRYESLYESAPDARLAASASALRLGM